MFWDFGLVVFAIRFFCFDFLNLVVVRGFSRMVQDMFVSDDVMGLFELSLLVGYGDQFFFFFASFCLIWVRTPPGIVFGDLVWGGGYFEFRIEFVLRFWVGEGCFE